MLKEYTIKPKHALNDVVFVQLKDGSVAKGYIYGLHFKRYVEGETLIYEVHHGQIIEQFEGKRVFSNPSEAFNWNA